MEAELPRPARMPAEQRREHLLDVATALIATDGIDAVTMEGVAAAAGVSKGLGYAYFTNKDDLLMAVLGRELDELTRNVTAAIVSSASFEGRIRAAVHAWLDAVEERGALLGTLLQAGRIQKALRPRRDKAFREMEAAWGSLAVRELGIPRDQAVAAAAILLAGLTGVLERYMGGDPRELLEGVFVDLAMRGLSGMR